MSLYLRRWPQAGHARAFAPRLSLSVITSLIAYSSASFAQDAAPSSAAQQQSVPLPTVVVGPSPAKPKTKKAKKVMAPTVGSAPSGLAVAAPATSTVRDASADTEGTNSYAAGAVTVAGKEPMSLREVPQSVSVITRQQMNDQNMNTVWDALTFAPGVTVVANDPSQGQYHARGYALGVMNDGMPAYNGLSGYQQFDLAIYDRVEVLRGPAGLFMGSGNPSGVVNMVKKRPRSEAGVAWSTSYGSWNNKWAELDVTTPLNESKTLRFRGVLAGRDREFFYDDADEGKGLGYGIVEYDLTPRTLLTVAAVQQKYSGSSWMGNPAYTNGSFLNVPRSTNVYPDWAVLEWDTREYSASIEHRFANDWLFKASVSRRDQAFHFNDAYPTTGVDPATMTATYAQRDAYYDYQRDAFDIYLNAPIHAFGLKHNLLVGYNYDGFSSENVRGTGPNITNVPILDPNSVLPHPNIPLTLGGISITEQSGFYGQARIKLAEPLTVIGGARLTDFNSKSRNKEPAVPTAWAQGAQAEDEFTPYGAVILDITREVSLYGSYADIFIPQTQMVWPSGTLPPRIGAQYEAGIKGEFFNKTVQTSLAYFDIKDTGRAYSDTAHPGYYIALGEVASKGIDAEISGRVLPGLDVMAGYTYLKTEFLKDASNQGLAISGWYPEHTFKLWAKYDFQEGPLDRWSIGAGVIALSDTANSITAPQRIQPAYAVVNTLVGYEFDDNVLATFSVNNIFDEAYYVRLGGLNTYNTYGEPRNYMLTVRKSFD